MYIDIKKITNYKSVNYGNYNIVIDISTKELRALKAALDTVPTLPEPFPESQMLRDAIDKEIW